MAAMFTKINWIKLLILEDKSSSSPKGVHSLTHAHRTSGECDKDRGLTMVTILVPRMNFVLLSSVPVSARGNLRKTVPGGKTAHGYGLSGMVSPTLSLFANCIFGPL